MVNAMAAVRLLLRCPGSWPGLVGLLLFVVVTSCNGAKEPSPPLGVASPTPLARQTPAPSPAALFLTILEPGDGSVVDTPSVVLRGRTLPGAVVTIEDEVVDVASDGTFSQAVTLEEGPNIVAVAAIDPQGNTQTSQIRITWFPSAVVPTGSPGKLFLTILEPADESVVDTPSVVLRGRTVADAIVSIGGELVDVASDGTFSRPLTLQEGPNVFDITALDPKGHVITAQLTVAWGGMTIVPSTARLFLTVLEPADGSAVGTASVVIRGRTPAQAIVIVGGDVVEASANGTFSVTVTLQEGPNVFDIVATDLQGNLVEQELTVSFVPRLVARTA